jgi:hypothetical protein
MERKPDDLAIGAFFDELARQPWLGYQRQLWPRFFSHVTNIENAASILRSGRLLCRFRALAEQCMVTDNASAEVLEQSAPWLFDHVRLYFRPCTPTFWHNEGIRPFGFRSYGAHCPVPVALLFDAKAIAGSSGVQFSDGNLASRAARLGDDLSFLRSLDFEDIYHNGPMSPERQPTLTTRRQAEVIIPDELALHDLRFVVTRSDAERQTLLTLLADTAWSHPPAIESVVAHSSFFHCRWTFIERVTLVGDQVRFLFNPDSLTPGPFDARFSWTDSATGNSTVTSGSLRGLGYVNVPVPVGFQGTAVNLTVHLDGSLAYAGTLEQMPSSILLGRR